ncbi:hypothetical protein KAI87_07540, partial [Myxococcota bacterium]|nr:hypothetical protein [Myxococcota bacterium]
MRAFNNILSSLGLTPFIFLTISLTVSLTILFPASLRADSGAPCPAVANLPHFTIDDISNPAIPVVDKWQIFYGKVPISDSQLASLAEQDAMIDMTRAELKARGTRIYLGML